MQKNREIFIILFAAVVLVSLTVGIVSAALVTQSITYQGKLTDAAGGPQTGINTMTFRLYGVSTGGTALDTLIQDVHVTNGDFTTSLAFNPIYYDSRALWLGVKIGTDSEMTPRLEIRPVPYALSLRPGASITSADVSSALNLQNIGGGKALNVSTNAFGSKGIYVVTNGQQAAAVHAIANGPQSNAIVGETTADGPAAVAGVTSGSGSSGVYAETHGPSSAGVYTQTSGSNSAGVFSSTSNASSPGISAVTGGLGSPAVQAISSQDLGINAVGKTGGGYFATSQGGTDWWSNRIPAVNIVTQYNVNPGITVNTTGLSTSPGVYSETWGSNSQGFVATTHGANSPGLYVTTYGPGSDGVYGSSSSGRGVYGGSTSGSGVEGVSTSGNGVYGSSSSGRGVYGDSTSGTGVGGVSTSGTGVRGVSPSYVGVWGDSTSGTGIYGHSDSSVGVFGATTSTDHKWGVYTEDYIYAWGIRAPDVDLAEYMPVTGDLTPGTVLIIGDDGKLQKSVRAYDTKVAGIISTSPAIVLGTKVEGNPGEAIVAISGRVPCKVDATSAPIHAGDLLTTSDRPGYAMKAVPKIIDGMGFYPDGTVLGKAMGSLETGTGIIEVLVTLQ